MKADIYKVKRKTLITGILGLTLSAAMLVGIFSLMNPPLDDMLGEDPTNDGTDPTNPEDPTPPIQPDASPYIYIGNFMVYLAGFPGDGSSEYPYIIENREFSGSWCTSSLEIYSVSYYIEIRNCTFRNAGISSILQEFGVFISESPHVAVTNCRFENSENGVLVLKSTGVQITNNTFQNIDETGITVDQSDDCLIFANTIQECTIGVSVQSSNDVSVSANQISDNIVAIMAEGGDNSSAYWNAFSDNIAIYSGDDVMNFTINGTGNFYSEYESQFLEIDLTICWATPSSQSPWLAEGGVFHASEPFTITDEILDESPLVYRANESYNIISNIIDGQTFGPNSPQMDLIIAPAIPASASLLIDGVVVNATLVNHSSLGTMVWAGKINPAAWAILSPGEHNLTIYAESVLGMVYNETIGFTIDNEAPTVQITVSPIAGQNSPEFTVEVQDLSPILFVEYQVKTASLTTGNISLVETAPNQYTAKIDEYAWGSIANSTEVFLWAHVGDSCNNNISVSAIIEKRLTPPRIEIGAAGSIYFGNTPASVQVAVFDDGLDAVWWAIEGNPMGPIAASDAVETFEIAPSVWETLPEGELTLRIYAIDEYGTQGSSDFTVVRDLTAPSITVIKPVSEEFGLNNLYDAVEYLITLADIAPIVSVEVSSNSTLIYSGMPSGQASHIGKIDAELWKSLVDAAYAAGSNNLTLVFSATDIAGNTNEIAWAVTLPEIQDYPAWMRSVLKIPLQWVVLGAFGAITIAAVAGWGKYALADRRAKKLRLMEIQQKKTGGN